MADMIDLGPDFGASLTRYQAEVITTINVLQRFGNTGDPKRYIVNIGFKQGYGAASLGTVREFDNFDDANDVRILVTFEIAEFMLSKVHSPNLSIVRPSQRIGFRLKSLYRRIKAGYKKFTSRFVVVGW